MRRLPNNSPAAIEQWARERSAYPVLLPIFTVATLPPADLWNGGWLHVSDESGGATPAFSDGSDWRRCTDRAVVS